MKFPAIMSYIRSQYYEKKDTVKPQKLTTKWIDCGCCGRVHEASGDDCRSFFTCDICGDCYHGRKILNHMGNCHGVVQSLNRKPISIEEE